MFYMHESDFHITYSCYGNASADISYHSPPPLPHFIVETLSSSKAKQSRKRLTSNLEGNPTSAESDSTDIEIQKAFVGKQRQLQ